MLLKAKDLTKSFGGLMAVNSVGLEVEAGEIIGLIGPNGAGKTTLFNILTGTLHPDSGTVIFDGKELSNTPPFTRCKMGLTRTFQIPRPFPGLSVLDNVIIGALATEENPQKAMNKAFHYLEQANIIQLSSRMASELTVGDRKRMELARALATEPKLILLDEIMAGLNPEEMQSILSLIQLVRSNGKTILLIEHIMEAVMTISDRIYVLNEGSLIAYGTPSEVASNPRVVKAYLGEDYEFVDSKNN